MGDIKNPVKRSFNKALIRGSGDQGNINASFCFSLFSLWDFTHTRAHTETQTDIHRHTQTDRHTHTHTHTDIHTNTQIIIHICIF